MQRPCAPGWRTVHDGPVLGVGWGFAGGGGQQCHSGALQLYSSDASGHKGGACTWGVCVWRVGLCCSWSRAVACHNAQHAVRRVCCPGGGWGARPTGGSGGSRNFATGLDESGSGGPPRPCLSASGCCWQCGRGGGVGCGARGRQGRPPSPTRCRAQCRAWRCCCPPWP